MKAKRVPVALRWVDIGKIGEEKYRKVLVPSKGRNPVKEPILLGFDSEFHPESGELISVQFAYVDDAEELWSKVYYRDRLTAHELLSLALQFLGECGVVVSSRKPRIYLICHFAPAEIGHITGYLEDFKLKTYNKALGAEGEFVLGEDMEFEDELRSPSVPLGPYRLRIIDLYAYFPAGLKAIGEMIGLPKLEVDRSEILKVLHENRAYFEAYACRDAEIAVKAFTMMRSLFIGEYAVDTLYYATVPAVAGAIFRQQFLSQPASLYRMEPVPRKVKTARGWTMRISNMPVYDGDLNIRALALQAYWGGRCEAYARGLIHGKFEYRDVVSLYPSACMLQPLPNQDTEWIGFNSLEDALPLEGFCMAHFTFPESCIYPCLPVMEEIHNKLYFPSQGRTFCTLSEIREALKLGAEINNIYGYGFEAEEAERNHDVARFMRHFMERKSMEPEGTLPYETWKLIMNALIGKFNEKRPELDIGEIQQNLIRASGFSLEQVANLLRIHRTRSSLKRPRRIGSLWWPESATLILGRGRALMAEFIAKEALFCSTDAVLLPKNVDISCDSLQQLRSIGSDLQLKHEVDQALIIRSRLYALWHNGAIVKNARHGTIASQEEFNMIITKCIEAGKDLELSAHKTRLIGLKEAIEKGKPLGSQEQIERPIYWHWDDKRSLIDPAVNPFTECTYTRPLKTAPSIEEVKQQIRAETPYVTGPIGRPPKLGPKDMKEIRKLHKQGLSYRKIAKQKNVSYETIRKALKHVK